MFSGYYRWVTQTNLKRSWCWERLKQEEKGTTEDEMIGWHHQLDGRESEQAPGVGDGQGSLACCSPWSRKESDMTEQLNWTQTVGFPVGSVVKNSPNNQEMRVQTLDQEDPLEKEMAAQPSILA